MLLTLLNWFASGSQPEPPTPPSNEVVPVHGWIKGNYDFLNPEKHYPKIEHIEAIKDAAKTAIDAPETNKTDEAISEFIKAKLEAQNAWKEFYAEYVKQAIEQAKTEAIRQELIRAQLIAQEQERIRREAQEEEQALMMMLFEM